MFPENIQRPPFTWRDYTSLLNQPEKLSRQLSDHPLFVIHPGFRTYHPQEDHPLSKKETQEYQQYTENLHHLINQSLKDKRTLFVYTPSRYLNPTLTAINHPPQAILVPTLGRSTNLDQHLLGKNAHKFYSTLTHAGIKKAQIAGEYRLQCCFSVYSQLTQRGIKTDNDPAYTYSPPNHLSQTPYQLFPLAP